MLQFAHPWFLLFLLLIPLLVWHHLRRMKEGEGSLRFASTILLEGARPPWTVRAMHVLFGLRLLALSLGVVAFARPQQGVEEEEILTEGIDIIVALDASGSMAAEDFTPRNRFQVAKTVVGQFIDGLRHDRVGLVVFAGRGIHPLPADAGLRCFAQRGRQYPAGDH